MKNIVKIARNVLINEAEAILAVADLIDEGFRDCVEHIHNSEGRVVITGIGKSAIIAQKIVATLNSTGSPSLFMHAADAIHGDLGMIQKEDTVICISKSGNTPEIKVLVPLIKRAGCTLVALTSQMDSYLGGQSDFILNGAIKEEACPNNLAPTTSTTVHLALGDALAICLLRLRNFSSEDFAQFHPGGTLGKQLYLKVSDISAQHELPLVKKDASVKEVILEISGKRLGAAAVIDSNRHLIGIITDGDLRRMLEKNLDFGSLKAEDIMSANPKTIHSGDFAVKAAQDMQQNHISQLIVVEDRKVVGFIHLHDLLKEGII